MSSAGSPWPYPDSATIRPMPIEVKCPSDADTEPGSDMELEDISDVLMDLVLVMRELIELLRAERTCILAAHQSKSN